MPGIASGFFLQFPAIPELLLILKVKILGSKILWVIDQSRRMRGN